MKCPNCGKKPIGFMGTFYLKGAGFKKAFQGLFRCNHCETLLIQEKNNFGLPRFEKPFWLFYSLLLLGIFAATMAAFYYIEDSVGTEPIWFTIPVILIVFISIFVIMDRIRARYWIIKETTLEEQEEEMESQKLSPKGVVLIILFGVLAFAGFILVDHFSENLSLTPAEYTISTIVYLMVILLMAFGLMKYISEANTPK